MAPKTRYVLYLAALAMMVLMRISTHTWTLASVLPLVLFAAGLIFIFFRPPDRRVSSVLSSHRTGILVLVIAVLFLLPVILAAIGGVDVRRIALLSLVLVAANTAIIFLFRRVR